MVNMNGNLKEISFGILEQEKTNYYPGIHFTSVLTKLLLVMDCVSWLDNLWEKETPLYLWIQFSSIMR